MSLFDGCWDLEVESFVHNVIQPVGVVLGYLQVDVSVCTLPGELKDFIQA